MAGPSGNSLCPVLLNLKYKVNKFLKESTLLGQPFIKDDSLTVGKYLKGANASVTNFIRYEVGEGLEKRSENFADEVQKQIDDLKDKDDDD